jgi:hypothetical protein
MHNTHAGYGRIPSVSSLKPLSRRPGLALLDEQIRAADHVAAARTILVLLA